MCFNTRKLKEVRIYCECYEQGLYLLDYIRLNKHIKEIPANIIYTKPKNFKNHLYSKTAQLFTHKDFDGMITLIDNKEIEHPIVTIEFSSAVPVDDHILQRFDFVYWSTFYKVPSIKISPTEVFNKKFGGGNKVKKTHEYYATLNLGGVYYHVNWPIIDSSDLALVDEEKISCPPILNELEDILNQLIETFMYSKDDNLFFKKAQEKYKNFVLNNYNEEELKFKNSSRYHFDNDELIMKFNRFGHGMDPERGMLVFWSQKLDKKPIVKFEVQRENLEDYKKLYEGNRDAEILNIIENQVLSNNNIITFSLAFDLFKKATNTEELFINSKKLNSIITINDTSLLNHLKRTTSVVNSLLHFGTKIILTDLKNNILVEIKWNNELVENFYKEKKEESLNLKNKTIPIKQITNKYLNEDIVTYTCAEIFKANKMKNIAVSYPGAQGDRKILYGNGRKVKREYIDTISVKEKDNNYYVILHENKEKLSETKKKDIDKLNNFRNTDIKIEKLNELIEKTYKKINIKDIFIGIGGKESKLKDETRFDYLINVKINEDGNPEWNIETTNKEILELFEYLKNEDNKLIGIIILPEPIHIVD